MTTTLDETMLYDAAICWRPDVLSEPDRTAIWPAEQSCFLDEIILSDFEPRVSATYNSLRVSDAASRTIAC